MTFNLPIVNFWVAQVIMKAFVRDMNPGAGLLQPLPLGELPLPLFFDVIPHNYKTPAYIRWSMDFH